MRSADAVMVLQTAAICTGGEVLQTGHCNTLHYFGMHFAGELVDLSRVMTQACSLSCVKVYDPQGLIRFSETWHLAFAC